MRAWLIAIGIIMLLSGGIFTAGYMYYTNTQEELDVLKQEKILAELNAQIADDTIAKMSAEAAEQERSNNILQAKLQVAQVKENTLLKTLRSHDLTKLAAAKPGMIEKRINDASKRAADDLEHITSQ